MVAAAHGPCFLLTPGMFRSYFPINPNILGLKLREARETGKICPSFCATRLVTLRCWGGCNERRWTEGYFPPPEILCCFLTTTAGPRLAPHPRGPKNLPLFQAQLRSMSCRMAAPAVLSPLQCISRLLRKLLGRWRFARQIIIPFTTIKNTEMGSHRKLQALPCNPNSSRKNRHYHFKWCSACAGMLSSHPASFRRTPARN